QLPGTNPRHLGQDTPTESFPSATPDPRTPREDSPINRSPRPWRVVFTLAGLAVAAAAFLTLAAHARPVAGRYIPRGNAAAYEAGAGPAITAQAKAFAGTPAVGALFTTSGRNDLLGSHFCTASVVDSPHRDLVLTAAHCVSRTSPNKMVF